MTNIKRADRTRTVTPPKPETPKTPERQDNTRTADRSTFEAARATGTNTDAPTIGAGLRDRAENGNSLRMGASGQDVREMQQLLNRANPDNQITVDGQYGPQTQRAVRSFQEANGLSTDGIAGRNTLGALLSTAGVAQTPQTPQQPGAVDGTNGTTAVGGEFAPEAGRANGTFAGTQAQREQQAEELLRANGQWPPREGETYAIQIDQDPPPASASGNDRSRYLRSYTGQTAVFRAENGRLVEQQAPLRSAAHPGQMSSGLSPDVTGDGRGDVAHLPSGVYEYGTQTNYRGRFNPTGDFQGYRDQNQDGTISGSEKDRRHRITAIQIHAGSSSRPSSIGCQTMPPSDYNQFSSAVRNSASGNSTFTYLLVRRPNEAHGANPI
ncbi:MAG TPA: hypothetical protein DCE42_22000 [Myxococcales bacterium]|nr:hypothetical protein [Deltaproteobacteria bacterium]MBU53834.1 hypothetical protein [Deltaproteobacteria bacterium]HAA57454.1 hypothetical protein [Myxococcales bacterium]|tara:strand:+ start:4739 stop:5884 length:1146 start_codon:yes stop_codon:yes gene_type:complete